MVRFTPDVFHSHFNSELGSERVYLYLACNSTDSFYQKTAMKKLIERQNISENLKAYNAYHQLNQLLNALQKKELPNETIDLINNEIEQLNSKPVIDKHFVKSTIEKQNRIIKLLEKKHKIVPINYYKKQWMLLGMSAFGIPMGLVISSTTGNFGMLTIGIPVGMAIGVALGSRMDKEAFHEGRQLDFEAKYQLQLKAYNVKKKARSLIIQNRAFYFLKVRY